MLTSSDFKMTFSFAIVSNIAITTLKFVNVSSFKICKFVNFSAVIAMLLAK